MRINTPEIDTELDQFLIDPKLPLYVRAHHDDGIHEWEVHYDKTPTCGYTIASFTTWREAYDWAYNVSRWAHEDADTIPRRWNYCYRPDGSWGEFGYWESTGKEEA